VPGAGRDAQQKQSEHASVTVHDHERTHTGTRRLRPVPSRPVRAHARSHRRWRWRWRWAARGPPSHTRIIARLTPPGAWRGRDKGNVCLFVFPSPPALPLSLTRCKGKACIMHGAAGRVRSPYRPRLRRPGPAPAATRAPAGSGIDRLPRWAPLAAWR
jgi:hypothetical protein